MFEPLRFDCTYNSVKNILHPCLKGVCSKRKEFGPFVYSKRKEFVPNSFLLEQTPFLKWLGAEKSEQKFTKVVSLVTICEYVPRVSSPGVRNCMRRNIRNAPSNMCAQRRFRSDCAFAKFLSVDNKD